MGESKHTLGPWWYIYIPQDSEFLVLPVAAGDNQMPWPPLAIIPRNGRDLTEVEANARLFAAASDMLAALKIAAEYFADPDGGNPERTEPVVLAAIAKAEGRS